jgi:uncharacterized protein YfaT (DUF1175 family)
VASNGSKWFRVEYATSIYINTNININNDQMKITKILNQIKEKLLNRTSYFNLTYNNKIISEENTITNKTNSNINNKDRNKYGFPTISN